ncbi:putative ABC transporter oligopeptide-binding protein [Roseobacter sp. GAI101]|uniref:putative ABC transporter oligopeptide-binding protein n=1 Tax=Roseobacter sp. (strain GAI101) TaxID=391589 RepID=UPI0001871DBE|nr:putative ABC transporter oligopeptide-binding protein [Roseobacter sp. GAI101]EEB82986.1 putative ABC transporter oligopeptide-binding protein [Roseobacter sp. GAI101]
MIWSNTQSYANPKVDELLNAAAVELDLDKRKALYAEFQQVVAQDLPIYWINATPYHTAYNSKLVNPPKGIWGTMHPMDMVEISE